MYYTLNEKVYLVKGHERYCIYDLKLSKLYSVNKILGYQLELVNQGKITDTSIEQELKEVFDKFLHMGVLILSETFYYHDIQEVKSIDSSCNFAWIEITTKCNLKCVHCYNETEASCDTTMTVNDFKLVVKSLMKLGVQKIQIIGGEPFFDRKILRQMLDYAIGKFELIEIFTNGTLITEEWYEYLADNNIHIALSVYSYEKVQHDKVTRCTGSWEKTNRVISLLREKKIPYRVCNVLMNSVSVGERNTELYVLSNEKDVVRMSGRAQFSLLSDELIRKKLITKKTFQTPIAEAFVKRLVSGHNCFKSKIYIAANLEIYPCVMERRFSHGSINQDESIVLDDTIRNLNKDVIEMCNLCEYRYACFDCRPNSLKGDIYEKPWYCTYNPIVGEWENEQNFIENLRRKWSD